MKCVSGVGTTLFFSYLAVKGSDASEMSNHSYNTAFSGAVQLPRICSKYHHFCLPCLKQPSVQQLQRGHLKPKRRLVISSRVSLCPAWLLFKGLVSALAVLAETSQMALRSGRCEFLPAVPRDSSCSVTRMQGQSGKAVLLCHLTTLLLPLFNSVSLHSCQYGSIAQKYYWTIAGLKSSILS